MAIRNNLERIREMGYSVNSVENPDIPGTLTLEITKADQDLVDNYLKGLQDGSLVHFKAVSNGIAPYRCYQFANLQSADLRGVTEIPNSCFSGCYDLETVIFEENTTKIEGYAFNQCYKLNIEELPKTIINVGTYGFYYGGNNGSAFEFLPTNVCSLGSYAFQDSSIGKIKGVFSTLGIYAFYNTRKLSIVDIAVNGNIGDGCFSSVASYPENLSLSIKGIVTALGSEAFRFFGSHRLNPETSIFNLDFSQGTFATLNQYTFAGNSTYPNKYMKIQLPATLTTVNQYAFRYTDYLDIYWYGLTPPALNSTAFNNATNYNNFVHYDAVNDYKNATNWSAIASSIKGFAPADTFTAGQTLPLYNNNGYAVTWYSDKEMTNQITTCPQDSPVLYCTVGTTKVAIKFQTLNATNCSAVLSDGSTTYSVNDMIAVGTNLTLTMTPNTSGWLPYKLSVNGVDVTSSIVNNEYTLTAGQDNIVISAMYWDGVNPPYDPVFANNDWATIKSMAKSGEIPSEWSVGDTKQLTVAGYIYDIRIADKQTGRYKYASDDSDTHIIFEAVQLIPTTTMWNPNSSYNYGGFENCQLRAFLNGGDYWTSQTGSSTTNIPLENSFYYALSQGDTSAQQLYSALEDMKFPCLTGGGATTVTRTATCKLFTASLAEMGYSSNTPYINESYLVQSGNYTWDYYLTHSSNSDKIKYQVGTTTARHYWLRSAYSGGYYVAWCVNLDGNYSYYNTNSYYRASFCFAF